MFCNFLKSISLCYDDYIEQIFTYNESWGLGGDHPDIEDHLMKLESSHHVEEVEFYFFS